MKEKLLFFVNKWASGYSKPNFFDDLEFVEDCRLLGFRMDGGESLVEATSPECLFDPCTFNGEASAIHDPRVIGNAIFSRWRSFNHGIYVVMTPDDERWFELAFKRLAELSDEA